MIDWVHDICAWWECLSWKQALEIVLLLFTAIVFVFSWDMIDEEFIHGSEKKKAQSESKEAR